MLIVALQDERDDFDVVADYVFQVSCERENLGCQSGFNAGFLELRCQLRAHGASGNHPAA